MTAAEPVRGSANLTHTEARLAAERYERFRAPETPEAVELPTPDDGVGRTAASITGNRIAHLRMETHRIEKGLSIAGPRRPFGKLAERRIGTLLLELDLSAAAGEDCAGSEITAAVDQAKQAIAALRRWNDAGAREGVVAALPAVPGGDDSDTATRGSLRTLLANRHTVRSFDAAARIDDERIDRAIEVARRAPSVCNRAAGRVHLFRDAEQIAALFQLQRGNRGLTGVTHVAVVTVELSMFAGTMEFAQPWIDGGLFLMNLVWGMEAEGLGACLLNWSMPAKETTRLRTTTGIPESELVVCLVAFGVPSPGSLRTRSAKPPLATVLTRHS